MATDVVSAPAPEDEPEEPSRPAKTVTPAPSRSASGGFFTIYKKGQGKWTRLGTIFAAAFIGGLTAWNLAYTYLPPYIHSKNVLFGIAVGFLVAFGLLTFWLTNKPQNVEFLIATDSEMKKVNWTTKGELFGSTRVVILFLFFIAIFLFLMDLVFAEFFYLISVLRSGPFQ